MKISQLKMGSILSLISILGAAAVQFIYTPIFLKYLGPSDYGINSFIQSVMGYLSILSFGFGTTMLRYTVQAERKGNMKEYEILHGYFFLIFLFLSLVCFICGIAIYYGLAEFLKGSFSQDEIAKSQKIFLILLGNMVISFPIILFSTYIRSKEKFIYIKLLSFLNLVISPLTSIILIKKGYTIIDITKVTIFYSLLTNFLYIFYSLKLKIKINFKIKDKKLLKEIMKFTLYIFLGILVDKLYWSADRVIIGKYLGTTLVGVYSVSSIFNQFYISLSVSISDVLHPRINQMIVEEKYQELFDLFIKVGRVQYILMGLIYSGFILFGVNFIEIWIGGEYAKDIYYMTIFIMLPLTIPLIQNTGIIILQARNLHKFRVIVYLIISILNIFFSIILVKKYGAIGCSIGTGISFFIGNNIIMNIYYHKKIKLNMLIFYKEIIKMTIPIIFSIFLGFVLNFIIRDKTLFYFISKIGTYILIYSLVMYLIGLNIKEKQIVKNILKKFYRKESENEDRTNFWN